MNDIKEFSLKELEDFFDSQGLPHFHAKQIFSWIYKKGETEFSRMTNLPAGLRQILKKNFSAVSLSLVKKLESVDGTEKFLFKLRDNNIIEAAAIPAEKRVTGCVSTQAGCRFCCRFCASGVKGFKRNLEVAEILEQVLYLKNHSKSNKLTHLVFMGTGEPLDNYDNVLKAIRIINCPNSFNIGARRITISTAGLVPQIKQLSEEGLQIELSISLHAPTDNLRSQIMPINRVYPLKELLNACRQYFKKTNRQITFEYILLKNMNSDLQNARDLSKILRGLNCKVNLIPANPIKELKVEPAGKIGILLFKDFLLKSGINVTLRKPRGKDIEAACGQFRLSSE